MWMEMAPAAALKLALNDDPTYYPEEEHLGEDVVQSLIVESFRPLLQRYMDERKVAAFVGADQMIYYTQYDASACVSPDVYVMPGTWGIGEDMEGRIGSWKKWECGVVPLFALEIMSSENKKQKDDRKSPARHDTLGTKELIVLDPYADKSFRMRRRTRFRIFRRNFRGDLVLVEQTNDTVIWSEALDAHLRVVGHGNLQKLRIATGPNGETLFPTKDEELAQLAEREAQRASLEAQRASLEAQRADQQARRAAEAEAELAQLRAQLAALQRKS